MPKLSSKKRQDLVDHLVGNCSCDTEPLFEEGDIGTLNKMELEDLERLASESVENEDEEDDDDLEVVYDEDEDEEEDSDDSYEDEDDDATENMKGKKHATHADDDHEENEDEEDDLEEGDVAVGKSKKAPPFKKKKKGKVTMNESPVFNEKDLPAEVLEDLQFARNMKRQKKDQLIAEITSNEDGLFTRKELNAKSIEELTKVASYATSVNNEDYDSDEEEAPRFCGSRLGGHKPTENQDETLDDMLETPVIEW